MSEPRLTSEYAESDVIGIFSRSAASQTEVVGFEPAMTSCVNAVLPVLPEPLSLKHGPLTVTIETWSNGDVVARLPCAALHGDGESDILAIEDLAVAIYDFVVSTGGLLARGEKLGGPLKKDWENVTALVDASALPR